MHQRRLLSDRQPDLVYLSLSDYVQHKHAPDTHEAIEFMKAVDARLAALLALVGVVADHGMTDMAVTNGDPNVIYVGDHLDEEFGPDATRVICPVTDPFVRHHGALERDEEAGNAAAHDVDRNCQPGTADRFAVSLVD
ncbi:alkaline phosphatase family protein [Sinorhizobium meliloti]|uniref:alkaline phosphatase family protein n=1 Tax=Rhizobium meliloti TaxID=382 RepID=UPI0013E2A691|nr:alkaline phosphatase family protein [Sinorhizobium meliloti]